MNPNDTINQINKTASAITASTGTPLTALTPVDASVPMDVSKFKTSTTTYPDAANDTTAHNALSSTVNGLADQVTTSQQNAATTAATTSTTTPTTTPKNTNLQDALAGILGISKKLGTQGQATLDAQNAEGVFAKQKASTDLENQIISKTRAYDKLIEQRRANTNGSFGGAVEQDIANLERQKNSELADLAIQYKVANDDYQGAVAIAKQKVDAEFQPLKDQLTTLQTYYQLSQNDMTESEKLQAQAVIQQKKDAIDFEQQKQLADYTEKIKQNDPLYKAQVADTYSSIASRNAALANPTGTYTPGSNPTVDGWISAINNGSAKITSVPANLKNSVIQGLSGDNSKASQLVTDAQTSAQQLLDSFNAGKSGNGVGVGSVLPVIPGTKTADFVRNLDNFKSLLSLDNVKYLKGQGQISDAERKLLADSATQLDRSQSPEQFKKTLQTVITTLGKSNTTNSSTVKIGGQSVPVGAIIENSSGKRGKVNADGTITPL